MGNLAVSALGTEPLEVSYRGNLYRFPCRTARPWILALCSENLYSSVLSLMDPEDYDSLTDDLITGNVDAEAVSRISRLSIAEAGGRPWWEVIKLIGSVFMAPSGDKLLGALVLRGVKAEEVSLAEFCCAVWARVTEHATGSDLMKLEAKLSAPIPGMLPDESEDEAEDFQAVAQRLRAMPGVSVG